MIFTVNTADPACQFSFSINNIDKLALKIRDVPRQFSFVTGNQSKRIYKQIFSRNALACSTFLVQTNIGLNNEIQTNTLFALCSLGYIESYEIST